MKKLITVLTFIIAIHSFSQTNHPDGPYKEYHKNGQLRKVGAYKNNKKVGHWTHFYEDGVMHKRYLHEDNGKFTGVEEVYSKKGVLISDTRYSETGNLLRKTYLESGGLFAEYELIPTKRNNVFFKQGNYKLYFENGVLKVQCNYNNNRLTGIWKQYYDTGELKWEVQYAEGYRQGFYKHYNKNGALKLKGSNKLDVKDGVESRYDSTGNISHSLKYKKGVLKQASKFSDVELIDVPDGLLERVPIYPGCERFLHNNERRMCMSNKIATFINEKFDRNAIVAAGITGKQKIKVSFKVTKSGVINDFEARSNSRLLSIEAIRVAAMLPNLLPGMKDGKPVTVPYSLPIVVMIR